MKESEDIIPFIRGSGHQFACIYRIQIDGIAMTLVQRVKSRPRTTVARVRYQYGPRGHFDGKTGFIFFGGGGGKSPEWARPPHSQGFYS